MPGRECTTHSSRLTTRVFKEEYMDGLQRFFTSIASESQCLAAGKRVLLWGGGGARCGLA